MAKQDNNRDDVTITALGPTADAVNIAKRLAESTEPDPTPEPRLRKIPATVTEDELEAIQLAITLKIAVVGQSPFGRLKDNGFALAQICSEWRATENARLREAAESVRLSSKGGAS